MKGRSGAKMFVLIAYLSAFAYFLPQLNSVVLSPALPDPLKYTLDFILLGVSLVLIYFGMSGEKKMDERKVQEIRDSVREEERTKLLLENPPSARGGTDNMPSDSVFGTNRIKVMFSGKAKVKLSALEEVEDMEITIPEKTVTPQPSEEPVTDEIEELLKEAPQQ